MKFETGEIPISNSSDIIGAHYKEIVQEIIEYINKIKLREKNVPLIDIIMDFAFNMGIDVEVIGDAIYEDSHFKSFIEKDCQLHNVINSKHKNIGEW
jgi:hypothetical protein